MSEEYGAFSPPGGLFDNPQVTKPAASLAESKDNKRKALARNRRASGTQRVQVYECICGASKVGGVTRDQIAQQTGLKLSTVCGRVNDLLTEHNAAGVLAPTVFVQGKRGGSGVLFAKGYC